MNAGSMSLWLGLVLTPSAAAARAEQEATARPESPIALPTRYDEDRFFVRPVTTGGVTLEFFTDTGGGLFIAESVAERIGLTAGGDEEGVPFPQFKPEASIPPPLRTAGKIFIHALDGKSSLDKAFENGGMLGQAWFSGRVWTFDYPGKQLWLHPDGLESPPKGAKRVPLGFPTSADGGRGSDFPRISVEIAGEALDLLFDTGATTHLSPEALKALDDGRPAVRATCFIAAVHFDRWRAEHPDWRVIEAADVIGDGREAMIQVPKVTIGTPTVREGPGEARPAAMEVGPVWFTRRANANFHQFMSQWMDKQVEGALGGNALRHFRVTVDYPKAVAYFAPP
ncbi:MAG: hypothetical protein C4547_12590 [Phycisphaerales bacterium]|nr:MAG: hypothetical protein C4547_12590 [Phycisphaerales bacterium]